MTRIPGRANPYIAFPENRSGQAVNPVVVGGGFSGLAFARLAPGSLVLEENPSIGVPPHCTGIVSEETVRVIGGPARESIMGSYRTIRVLDLSGKEILTLAPRSRIFKLDRIRLERIMAEEAEARGSKILRRARALSADHYGNITATIEGSVKSFRGDLVVVAEGSSQRLSRSLGLSRRPELFLGIQGLVSLQGSDEEEILVFVSDTLFRGFFAWLVPLSGRVGVAGFSTALRSFSTASKEIFVRRLQKMGIIRDRSFSQPYGGLIVRGRPSLDHLRKRVIAIGDSANFVKPFSGGGLYPSSLQASLLAASLAERGEAAEALLAYSKRISRLVKVLGAQLGMARLAERLGVERILKTLSGLGLLRPVEVFDFDRHDLFFTSKALELLRTLLPTRPEDQ